MHKHEEIESLHKSIKEQVRAFRSVGMNFSDFKSFDFEVKIGEWVYLPDDISGDAQTMGVFESDEKIIILTAYGANGYISPHYHSDSYELIEVLHGVFEDKVAGQKITVGEKMDFDVKEKHYITSKTGGVMKICFAKSKEHLNFEIPNEAPK